MVSERPRIPMQQILQHNASLGREQWHPSAGDWQISQLRLAHVSCTPPDRLSML